VSDVNIGLGGTNMTELMFVVVNHNCQKRKRDQELDESSIRSHAARAVHRRKRTEPKHVADRARAALIRERVKAGRSVGPILPMHVRGDQDTFQSYLGATLPSIILEAIDYNVSSWLSTVFGKDRKNERDPAVTSMRRRIVQNPYVLHAQAVVAAGFIARTTTDAAIRHRAGLISLEQQDLAFGSMREEITTSVVPSDGLILSAFALAISLGRSNEDVFHVHPPSPFAQTDLA
jgi:hypothetical protein